MKLASNFTGLREHGNLVLKHILNGGMFANVESIISETGLTRVATDHNRKFVKIGERYYEVVFNKNGNIKNAFYFANTYKGKELEIGKYEVIARYATSSDRGSHLINGLLFENGYGDGYNTVEVRKFKTTSDTYHSRSEIYGSPLRISPCGVVKVWESDCDDPNKDEPLLSLDNVFKIIINRTSLILCVN